MWYLKCLNERIYIFSCKICERKVKVIYKVCDFESYCIIYWFGIDGIMNWILLIVFEWI